MTETDDKIQDFKKMSEDDIIRHYIHKKFRSTDLLTRDREPGVIRRVNIRNTVGQSGPALPSPAVRKSVIVRREDAKTELEIELEMKSESNETDQIMISLNVEELENLFTTEEESYFTSSLAHFASCWHSIPQGPELMSLYSAFCQNPQPLSVSFMKLITGKLR